MKIQTHLFCSYKLKEKKKNQTIHLEKVIRKKDTNIQTGRICCNYGYPRLLGAGQREPSLQSLHMLITSKSVGMEECLKTTLQILCIKNLLMCHTTMRQTGISVQRFGLLTLQTSTHKMDN